MAACASAMRHDICQDLSCPCSPGGGYVSRFERPLPLRGLKSALAWQQSMPRLALVNPMTCDHHRSGQSDTWCSQIKCVALTKRQWDRVLNMTPSTITPPKGAHFEMTSKSPNGTYAAFSESAKFQNQWPLKRSLQLLDRLCG